MFLVLAKRTGRQPKIVYAYKGRYRKITDILVKTIKILNLCTV